MSHASPQLPFQLLARVLRAATDECDAIARESAEDRREWVCQSESPLGPRRHIAAVRRRLRAGTEGAGQAGRKYLLSPEALAEELGRPVEPKSDETDSLRRELSMIRGGRR